jgi:alkylhydroperoxidase family enzyme
VSRVAPAEAPEGAAATFEAQVAKLQEYETSDLPERTKMALRLADAISMAPEVVDEHFYGRLRQQFSDDEILDLGMTVAFFSGWQRFIEAFKIVPDRWHEGDPDPWRGPRDEPS